MTFSCVLRQYHFPLDFRYRISRNVFALVLVGKITLCRNPFNDMPALWLLLAVLEVKDTLSRYLLIDIGDKVRKSHEYREAHEAPSEQRK